MKRIKSNRSNDRGGLVHQIEAANNSSESAVGNRRVGFLGAITVVGLVATFFLGLANLSLGNPITAIGELFFSGISAINLYLLYKLNKFRISANIGLFSLSALLLLLIFTGGLGGTGIFWIFMQPSTALFLFGLRVGFRWVFGFFTVYILIFIGQILGLVSTSYTTETMSFSIISFVIYSIIVYVYESSASADRNSLAEKAQALEHTSEKLSQEIETKERIQKQLDTTLSDVESRNRELEGVQTAMLNLLEDIDEEKKNIQELSTRDEALLKSIGEGVAATDETGKIIRANRQFIDLIGNTERSIIGKPLNKVIQLQNLNGKDIEQPAVDALTTGKPVLGTYFLALDATNKLPVSVTASPYLVDSKPAGAVVTMRDVTKEYEIDRAKTEFVSIASHQLRTPLTAISWYLELLMDGQAGKISSKVKEYVEQVYRASRRMNALVGALLNVSRLDLGTLLVEPKPIYFSEVVTNAVDELEPSAKEKKQKLILDLPKNRKKIPLDNRLVYIIAQNLISNAIKYSPENSKIEISVKYGPKWLEFVVADHGYGIPKQQQDKIFSKLFRADNVLTKETDGTGLGLYIVKSILDKTGGSITFESLENKGTTFHVRIPISGMKAKSGTRVLDTDTNEKA